MNYCIYWLIIAFVFVIIDPPTPTDENLMKLFQQTNQLLIRSQSFIKDLEQYTGCEELIRLVCLFYLFEFLFLFLFFQFCKYINNKL